MGRGGGGGESLKQLLTLGIINLQSPGGGNGCIALSTLHFQGGPLKARPSPVTGGFPAWHIWGLRGRWEDHLGSPEATPSGKLSPTPAISAGSRSVPCLGKAELPPNPSPPTSGQPLQTGAFLIWRCRNLGGSPALQAVLHLGSVGF